MIAVDTNILVYAVNPRDPMHDRAAECVRGLVASPAWGIPSGVAFEFFATVTDPRAADADSSVAAALSGLSNWLEAPGCAFLEEPRDIWQRARPLIEASGVRGRLVHDARIAATCIAHGVRELWTADGDFLRFPQLRVRNPLVQA